MKKAIGGCALVIAVFAGFAYLILMNEDLPATIAWFRTPARVLDWTSPRDLILRGDFPKVCNLVSEVHSGLSL